MASFGITLPSSIPEPRPDRMADFARRAEQAGVDSLWVTDRMVYRTLSPLIVLGAAAGVTQRVRLGTSILLSYLRSPFLLAKDVATLDALSGGRAILGIGIGNREDDANAAGVPFKQRAGRTEEGIDLMRKLWSGEPVTHHGRYFHMDGLTLRPKPVQRPGLPIWIAGRADGALERAGRLADGFICSSSSLPNIQEPLEKVYAAARRHGRDPAKIEPALLVYFYCDPDTKRAVEKCSAHFQAYYGRVPSDVADTQIVGPPQACIDRLQSYVSKGVRTFILGATTPEESQLDLLGEKILPQLRRGA